MKVNVTISNDEIREAIVEWMVKKGLPVVLCVGDSDAPSSALPPVEMKGYNSGWTKCDSLRLVVEFEVDAYSSDPGKA